jgi:hypothetical protein
MIKAFLHEALLKARMKTGLSGTLVACAIVAVIASLTAFVFFLMAAYQWLAHRYDSTAAALILAGAFLLIAILGLIAMLLARRQAVSRARTELLQAAVAKQQSALGWVDPKMLALGMQAVRLVGVKRILPLAGVALLAVAIGREWGRPSADDDPPPA